MRQAGARAPAVLLVGALLALVAPGCDLVSSLTPFGIGHQDYSSGEKNVNGVWAGTTASGGAVTFQVGNDVLSKLNLTHISTGCTLKFVVDTISARLVDDTFSLEMTLETGGRFLASGTFTSATTCTGSYRFEGRPAGVCPTAAGGTFTANKKP